MAEKKLKMSEVIAKLKEAGVPIDTIEDILDDDTNQPIPTGKSYASKLKELTDSQAKIKEVEANLGQWGAFGEQLKPYLPQIQDLIAKAQGRGSAAAEAKEALAEIWNDPLYKPLHGEFSSIKQAVEQFGNAFKSLVQDYQARVQQVTATMNDLYEFRMAQEYPDFKENRDAIFKYGNENKSANWKSAYEAYKGSRLPEEVKKAEAIAMEAGKKAAKEEAEASRMEMGHQPPGQTPSGESAEKNYDKGWDHLTDEFKKAGFG